MRCGSTLAPCSQLLHLPAARHTLKITFQALAPCLFPHDSCQTTLLVPLLAFPSPPPPTGTCSQHAHHMVIYHSHHKHKSPRAHHVAMAWLWGWHETHMAPLASSKGQPMCDRSTLSPDASFPHPIPCSLRQTHSTPNPVDWVSAAQQKQPASSPPIRAASCATRMATARPDKVQCVPHWLVLAPSAHEAAMCPRLPLPCSPHPSFA